VFFASAFHAGQEAQEGKYPDDVISDFHAFALTVSALQCAGDL
jgi:hypothetical protein